MQQLDPQAPPEPAESDHVIFEGHGGVAEPYRWCHMTLAEESQQALLSDPAIPPALAWAMVERDTQPRAVRSGDATLLILRGINKAPTAEPEDMISIRIIVTPGQITSLEVRRLPHIDALIADFRAGRAPSSVDDFVLRLIEELRQDAEPVLDALEDDVARLEQKSLQLQGALTPADRAQLTDARQDAIMLHRFIAPQAAALEALGRQPPTWLDSPSAVIEEAEAFRRIGADLDAVRSRAQVIAEEINIAMTERTNRIMLTLSAVSVVFLPLTFLTGLLGVNLAGIPYADRPYAFWAFTLLLGVVMALGLWLARKLFD